MLCYHNRIRVNFVSNCASQLVEKNNRLISAAKTSIICYVTEKWCYMFIHIHKGGEINPAMGHLEPSTLVSVIKFFTITSASHHHPMTDGSSQEKHFGKISQAQVKNTFSESVIIGIKGPVDFEYMAYNAPHHGNMHTEK